MTITTTAAQPLDLDKLSGNIFNLPCKMRDSDFANATDRLNYKLGHRDARHAAVDLIAQARAAQPVQAGEAVVGHAELNRFMDGYCNGKPELMACAQAAMFFFNACARAPAAQAVIGTDEAYAVKYDDGKKSGWVRSNSDPVVTLFSLENAESLCLNSDYTVRKVGVTYVEIDAASPASTPEVAPAPIYQFSSLGEGNWSDCTKSFYDACPKYNYHRRIVYAAPTAGAATTSDTQKLLDVIWRINNAVLEVLPYHPDPDIMRSRYTKAPMEVLVNVETLARRFKGRAATTSEDARELRLAICDIPLPVYGSNSFQQGFVSAKEAVLDLLDRRATQQEGE